MPSDCYDVSLHLKVVANEAGQVVLYQEAEGPPGLQEYGIAALAERPPDLHEVIAAPVGVGLCVVALAGPVAVGRDRHAVRQVSPTVRFLGRNYVLPRTGQKGIPLVSVNSKSVKLKIYHIGDRSLTSTVLDGNFSRQINSYSANKIARQQGQQIWEGDMPVDSILNKEVTTAFPIDKALPTLKAGLYVMIAKPNEKASQEWAEQATQWFVISDLGLTAFTGNDGIHAFVRSLGSAAPVTGAKIRLLARNNEILGHAETDDSGHVLFNKALTQGQGGNEPAMLIAEQASQDYAFLDLTSASFDLTDRGVGGRNTPGALDPFIYTERGVYRPGEEVHVTALLRDDNGAAVENMPLTLVYERPDSMEHQRFTLKDEGAGGRTNSFALKPTAMTGTWQAKIYTDPKSAPIGQTSFLVEDYVPERLELKLTSPAQPLAIGETAKINIDGRYLYGAPGSDLALDGEITIAGTKGKLDEYPDYRFGIASEKTPPVRRPLFKLPRTDKDGKATVETIIPRLPQTNGGLRASINLRLLEPGGRAVAETVSFRIKPSRPIIGIKPLFENDHSGDAKSAAFQVMAVGTDLKPAALKGLSWELVRINRHFQWYNHNGSWRYEPVTYTNRIANGDMDLSAEQPFKIQSNIEPGRYRLSVTSATSDGPTAEYDFTAGWYPSETADTPDILDVALDKKAYKPGDTANITISPRAAGKALIAIMRNRLIATKLVDVNAGDNTISMKVDQDWAPGAYVTATVYRPMDQKARRMPSRAIGVKWLPLDNSAHTLTLNLGVPETARPNDILTVPVKLDGLKPGATTKLVLAAVDVGILNLTNYKSPEPTAWYYGKRRLGTEIRDLYGRLIDGMQGVRGRIRVGGDGASFNSNATPPSQEPLALFSGIVNANNDGTAEVSFDIPAFDGTLRLMAVAWNKSQLGEIEKDIIIRDPVVMTATTPRFLTAGDKSEFHVTVDNVGGAEGDYSLTIDLNGLNTASGTSQDKKTLPLKKAERRALSLPISAEKIGDAKISLTLRGPNDYQAQRSYALRVFPAAPSVKRQFVSKLSKDGGKLTIDKDAVSGLIPDSAKISVNVGPTAALDVPGLLLALDRYPHGCAEQITSRALPLLYLSSVAQKSGLAGDKGARERVQKAIDRLTELQDSSGAFGLWAPADNDLWLTAYITDFLTRAKETGYSIKPESFRLALDRLANFINYAPDFSAGGQDVAYALYVLARNSRANIGDLRYYADTKIDNFATPLARAQLGAALSLYGDKARSVSAFRSSLNGLDKMAEASVYRSDYGTTLRDGAAALTLISETGVERQEIPNLTSVLERLRATKSSTTTQENAWLLLAANALLDNKQPLDLTINGTVQYEPFQRVLKPSDLNDGPFIVTNKGAQDLSASVTIHGASLSPEPPAAKGFSIERTYYTLDGKKADLANVKQNDRLVALIAVKEQEPKRGRVILVDRLPAGFEIENPKLVSGSDTKSLAWLGNSLAPAHKSFRDDRFVAAFQLGSSAKNAKPATAKFAYIVRAVVPGNYIHPAAIIEDMYRPDRFAQTGGGEVTITRVAK